MKWKIEGKDGSGDDVIVMVEADDAETATRQANFAGVKVKTIHPDEDSQPPVRLPPVNLNTAPAVGAAPPGYSGKVIVEREDDEHSHASSFAHHLHLPRGDAGTIASIASHVVALALLMIGVVVFLRGWILYDRVAMPVISYSEDPAASNATTLLLSLAWQQSLAYIGQMLIGLLIVVIAILIEGFMTRMVSSIRETWHKK
jgi:hypothetical protein